MICENCKKESYCGRSISFLDNYCPEFENTTKYAQILIKNQVRKWDIIANKVIKTYNDFKKCTTCNHRMGCKYFRRVVTDDYADWTVIKINKCKKNLPLIF